MDGRMDKHLLRHLGTSASTPSTERQSSPLSPFLQPNSTCVRSTNALAIISILNHSQTLTALPSHSVQRPPLSVQCVCMHPPVDSCYPFRQYSCDSRQRTPAPAPARPLPRGGAATPGGLDVVVLYADNELVNKNWNRVGEGQDPGVATETCRWSLLMAARSRCSRGEERPLRRGGLSCNHRYQSPLTSRSTNTSTIIAAAFRHCLHIHRFRYRHGRRAAEPAASPEPPKRQHTAECHRLRRTALQACLVLDGLRFVESVVGWFETEEDDPLMVVGVPHG
ncbi:hypothetical protein IWZ00DRAFT_93280 [Phyllosticta capitalensis]